ncbi:MAG: hypothetical protein JRF40_04225, partial [Deltaproteobacteria bacterium]|nr:hypothetical protein [Deltaproteobacteria bacterium]
MISFRGFGRHFLSRVFISIIAISIIATAGGCIDSGGDDDDEVLVQPDVGPGEGTDPGAILDDGTTGNPVFTLTWSHLEADEGPDVDMWVIDPTNAMLSTSRDGASLGPTAEGGAIDYDDQGETGSGDGGGPERAFWPAGSAPAGVYNYGVRYYTGSGSADYMFRVYKEGSVSATSTGTLSTSGQRQVLGAACNVPAVQNLCDLYNSNPTRFEYCQDLAYAEITGSVPPSGISIDDEKAEIKNLLDQNGYSKVYEGAVPNTYDPNNASLLEDGDIIMFYSGPPPNDPTKAPHYAVVYGGKIYQILHWGEGGQLDGPRDLSFFGNSRS